MSTRCQIGFYQTDNHDLLKPDALLYRHSDGYPGTVDRRKYGVLCDLVPFLCLFHKRRGLDDVEYAAAWTLHHLVDCHIQHIKELHTVHPSCSDYYPEDGRACIGFGVCKEFHGDIEYYYAVQGPVLKVYEANFKSYNKEPQVSFFKLIKTVSLVSKKKIKEIKASVAAEKKPTKRQRNLNPSAS